METNINKLNRKKKMKTHEIKIGKKVKYFSIIGFDKFIETEITSEPWEICGTMCCMIKGVRGGVSIEHLEEMKGGKDGN